MVISNLSSWVRRIFPSGNVQSHCSAKPDKLVDEATKQMMLDLKSENAIDKYVSLKFPSRIGLSIIEAPCVLRCRMCPQYRDEYRYFFDKKRLMSWEVFSEISRQVPNDPAMQLEVSAYCDPLQHPDCIEFIKHFRKDHPDVYIILATEGVLLDEQRAEALMSSGVTHISYSLNAGSRERYEWLCGRDKYEVARKNLHCLIAMRDNASVEQKPIITTHIIGIEENEPDFEAFVDYWREYLPDGVAIRTFGNWGGLVNGHVTPLDNWKDIDWDNRYPCLNPFSAIKIVSNGDFFACFLDMYSRMQPFGNILATSIDEVWGTGYEKHRGRHLNCDYDMRLCSQCMVWSVFPNLFEKNPDGKYVLKK